MSSEKQFSLKNRPEILVPAPKFAPKRIWCNPEKSAEQFEGFEKKQRKLLAMYEKSDHIEHWAISEFIKKEILGE